MDVDHLTQQNSFYRQGKITSVHIYFGAMGMESHKVNLETPILFYGFELISF